MLTFPLKDSFCFTVTSSRIKFMPMFLNIDLPKPHFNHSMDDWRLLPSCICHCITLCNFEDSDILLRPFQASMTSSSSLDLPPQTETLPHHYLRGELFYFPSIRFSLPQKIWLPKFRLIAPPNSYFGTNTLLYTKFPQTPTHLSLFR